MSERMKVLLADDEPWVLKGLQKKVDWEKLGFVIVGEAEDGETAWAKLRALKPDVLFTDIRMPSPDGLELLELLRKNNLPCIVVIISGYAEFAYARQGIQYGAFDYLVKPLQKEKIEDVLLRIRRRESAQGAMADEAISNHLIHQVMEDIQHRFCEELSLGELAARHNVSVPYLSSLFKKQVGQNYTQYLAQLRMTEAKRLLGSTNKSVLEVAQLCGYRDYFYFIKAFKKHVGVSPSKYHGGSDMK